MMMHQASIEAGAAAAEQIVRALEEALEPEAVAVGWFERGHGRFEIFAHYDQSPPRDLLLKLIAQSAGGVPTGPLSIEVLPEVDWVTLSQGKRGPVASARFLVHGSHDRTRVARTRFSIEIDAGQAFGTAHHASTRGCLLALDDVLKRLRPRTVVDIGTGTGVLAIAAAKLLGQRVTASDSDPIAVRTAAENARANSAGPLLRTIEAHGFDHRQLRHGRADLIVANLVEGVLYSLAPDLVRHLAPGGRAILSGLTESQAGGIEARYRSLGFAMEKRFILDGWATLLIVRRNARPARD
jgi:ribosomal protein L11 methyltransferase